MSVFQLLFALHFLKSSEVCRLVEDLDLDFPDSFLCISMRDELARQRDPLAGLTFEKELAEFECQHYSNLLEVYAKHNSKGKKRSFGCSVEQQLSLF